MYTEVWPGFFLFCLDLELLLKMICKNNSRSKQNKKNHEDPFVNTGK